VTTTEIESKNEKKVATVEHQWELVNKNKALWEHSQSKVTDDEYGEFYKSLINYYEKYLLVKDFRTEGNIVFTILLFVSKHALYDLFEPKKKFNKSNFMFDVFLS
jgi:molecular chaperone HtpG